MDGTHEPRITPAGFFVLRTPLLSRTDLEKWSSDLESPLAQRDARSLRHAVDHDIWLLRRRLRDLVERRDVQEALYLASPALMHRLHVWLETPTSAEGQRLEGALVRYFLRMVGRSTPFGLFAGVSGGVVGDRTELSVADRSSWRRHARLDFGYLTALCTRLCRTHGYAEAGLRYVPNTSLYEAAGQYRYIETLIAEDSYREYRLAAVTSDPLLAVLLRAASSGATVRELTQELVGAGIEAAAASSSVGEVIDAQILVPEIQPSLTGPDPLQGMVALLDRHDSTRRVAMALADFRSGLDRLNDAPLGVARTEYEEVAQTLKSISDSSQAQPSFHVDLHKGPAGHLGRDVAHDILRAVELLYASGSVTRPVDARAERLAIEAFKEAFVERFGDAEVPLLLALDEDTGLGSIISGRSTVDPDPLLANLPFGGADPRGSKRHTCSPALLVKVGKALSASESEIHVSLADFGVTQREGLRLPDAFAVLAEVASPSRNALASGSFQVHVKYVREAGGMTWLGRFCHGDQALLARVEEHLRAEEANHPDACFAEIVHLPQGRAGNFLTRPVLRAFEIPYLGRSGIEREHQVQVTDLRVSVREGRVRLRSVRLDREVIPRLSTAHDVTIGVNLTVYRFLCFLQFQDHDEIAWKWDALEALPFLPRVVCGRAVLSRARWLLARTEVRKWRALDHHERFHCVQGWRHRSRVPRYISVGEGDNQLLVDLDNPLSVDAMLHVLGRLRQPRLHEAFPAPEQWCATGPDGVYAHELVLPFHRRAGRTPSPACSEVATTSLLRLARDEERRPKVFAPGSEWLFCKLYTGPATADRVLRLCIQPLIAQLRQRELIQEWFFIRYADPDFHLRVRLHTRPRDVGRTLLVVSEALAHRLVAGAVRRLQVDTYFPEVNRYGGAEAIELAERIFCADSDAVLSLLELMSDTQAWSRRWEASLVGVDMLLSDLELDMPFRVQLLVHMRAQFGSERELGTHDLWKAVGARYRRERARVEAMLGQRDGEDAFSQKVREIIADRSQRVRPIVQELREMEREKAFVQPVVNLIPNFCHMYMNRLQRSAFREHELVIYDFLIRGYRSTMARTQDKC